MQLNRNKMLVFTLILLAAAALACGSSASRPVASPLPAEGLGLDPATQTSVPTVEPIETQNVEEAQIQATPILPTEEAVQPVQFATQERPAFVEFRQDEFGFSMWVRPDWQSETTTEGVTFFYPADRRIWLGVYRDEFSYAQSIVDEQVTELRIEEILEVDPNATYYEPYPFPLASVQNGRATDYIYIRDSVVTYGSVTVGTTITNETWIVQWEAPESDYPYYIDDFVFQLEQLVLLDQSEP